MDDAFDYWSLPELLDRMPPPHEPLTSKRPALRQAEDGTWLVQGTDYLPIVERIWHTFSMVGLGERGQEDYPSWRAAYLAERGAAEFTPDMVAGMSRRECLYLLRAVQRSERFSDGAWAEAHAQGLFHAVARRLVELAGGRR